MPDRLRSLRQRSPERFAIGRSCLIGIIFRNDGVRNGDARRLGALTPEAALEYMKTEKNLVIVDVAAKRYFDREHFAGAVNIPIEELDGEEEDELYAALPKGRPVLLHCRLGMIVPGAYERLAELRPDIPEIAYIDGAPLFREYNEWLAGREGK